MRMKNCHIALYVLLLATMTAHAQKLYRVSLSEFTIDTNEINFTVSEIVDARRDKNSIGIIQTGLNNKPNFAVFEKPGLAEIEQLLKTSKVFSQTHGLSLRITTLKISENTTLVKETAKAELSIDFFVPYENRYYYLNSVFTSAEPKGVDVTSKQAANIVTVVEKALILFSRQKNEADPDRSFTKEELLDPSLSLRDPLSMPIFTDQQYREGYYASFDEFVNNQPSIGIDCKIKLSNPVRAICGEKGNEILTLYGFAKDNKLYILYHRQFFELEKRNETFYFNGPTKVSKNSTNNPAEAYFGASTIAGTFIAPRGKYTAKYMVDMKTGAVRNLTGF
jgi:hypothetical protein